MGSPGSPPFSMCICMYYEHNFYSSIRDISHFSSPLSLPNLTTRLDALNKFVRTHSSLVSTFKSHNIAPADLVHGCRYVDDLFSLATFFPSIPHSRTFIELLLDALNNYYDKNMIVEMDTDDPPFKYLESHLTVGDRSIMARHRDKNIESLLSSGKLTLFNLQHFSSYQPRQTQLGLVISTLYRIHSYCSTPSDVFLACLIFFAVLSHLSYPLSIMTNALHRVYHRLPLPIWHLLIFALNQLSLHRS